MLTDIAKNLVLIVNGFRIPFNLSAENQNGIYDDVVFNSETFAPTCCFPDCQVRYFFNI